MEFPYDFIAVEASEILDKYGFNQFERDGESFGWVRSWSIENVDIKFIKNTQSFEIYLDGKLIVKTEGGSETYYDEEAVKTAYEKIHKITSEIRAKQFEALSKAEYKRLNDMKN